MKPIAPMSTGPAPRDARAELRRLAHQLEGVFLQQLFQAMRASVPQGGAITPEPGNQMFTGLFDEAMASQAADRMQRGIGEALYRQMSRHLPPETTPSVPQDRTPSLTQEIR